MKAKIPVVWNTQELDFIRDNYYTMTWNLITEERKRQIEVEGYTPEKDGHHTDDELALLATCYAMPQSRRIYYPCAWRKTVPSFYPNWNTEWWKPTSDDRIRELTKAGALIAAEIDRLLLKERRTSND